ncbi:MAG: response regulator, partial [Elusimicrobia bacterium]|nr:response regulator [Elusimicrobiota bacterium]
YYPPFMSEQFGERTFTTFEVARLCGVFHTTVINWVNKGKLKARVTPGGHRRIPLSELVPFMKKYDMPVPADIEDPHRHILILDDEPMMTRLIEKGFSKAKDRFSVQLSNNPVDALVQVGKKLPDLLVMDLMMPVMDGFQVCQILKSSPATKDMKIVVISGRKLTAAQQDFLAKNVDLFMQKPFEMNDLLSAVDRVLA